MSSSVKPIVSGLVKITHWRLDSRCILVYNRFLYHFLRLWDEDAIRTFLAITYLRFNISIHVNHVIYLSN
jgi:hypothetical protein